MLSPAYIQDTSYLASRMHIVNETCFRCKKLQVYNRQDLHSKMYWDNKFAVKFGRAQYAVLRLRTATVAGPSSQCVGVTSKRALQMARSTAQHSKLLPDHTRTKIP